ncbi:hypothetical protein HK097_002891, partial [Rhizophlyctis rosea]
KESRTWKAESESVPSQPSEISRQKESRQLWYFKGLVNQRFLAPINQFDILMNVASAIALGLLITGCVLSIITDEKITCALNEAISRMVRLMLIKERGWEFEEGGGGLERGGAGLEADKAKLLRDADSARDLRLPLERTRHDFQKRCSALALDLEQMHGILAMLDTGREGLVAVRGAEKLKCERLEHLIAVERTRLVINLWKLQDVQQAKGNLEAQLRALNEQQAITIQSLGDELKVTKREGRSLRSRVECLEGRVSW